MNNTIYQAPVNMEPKDTAHIEGYIKGPVMPWIFNSTQTPLIEHEYEVEGSSASFFWAHCLSYFGGEGLGTRVTSSEFHFFHRKFQEWHEENNIKYDKIFRSCINLNVHHTAEYSVPHLDHPWEHRNWIWYLETVENAQTLLFDDKVNIIKEIDCVKNTAISFDGSIRHAHRYPPIGRARRVVVFTYI
jgi:hypothetical protein